MMAGPFDRVPGMDQDGFLPAVVRQRMAESFEDPSTPEGDALTRTFVSAWVADPALADGTDRTAHLQALLDAANASETRKVVEVNADFRATGLLIGSGVTLRGTGAIRNPAGATGPVLLNADRENGNTGIRLEGLTFDGNRENVVGNQYFSTVDLQRVSKSKIKGVSVRGGCRSTTGSGGDGEGIVLRLCDENDLDDMYLYENDYDGLKLRSSHRNTISNVRSYNNERSGIQVSFYRPPGDSGGPAETVEGGFIPSTHNVITNVSVYHATGVKSRGGASTNSGIGLHGAQRNTITNVNVWGTQAGFDVLEGSHDNHVSNFTIYTRGREAGLNLYSYGNEHKICRRNVFENGAIYGFETAWGYFIKAIDQDSPIFRNIRVFRGEGADPDPFRWQLWIHESSTNVTLDNVTSDDPLATFLINSPSTKRVSSVVAPGSVSASPTSSYAVATGIKYVLAGGGGTAIITLPANSPGREVTVVNNKTDGSSVTVQGAGTINGAASRVLAARYDTVRLVSGGSTWLVV